jgi:hypothetical protein
MYVHKAILISSSLESFQVNQSRSSNRRAKEEEIMEMIQKVLLRQLLWKIYYRLIQ